VDDGLRQRIRLRAGRTRREERERDDGEEGEDCAPAAVVDSAQEEKLTCGASRAAPSTSKYSRGWKWNREAITLVGTVWSALP
jgi:hypothetical protein